MKAASALPVQVLKARTVMSALRGPGAVRGRLKGRIARFGLSPFMCFAVLARSQPQPDPHVRTRPSHDALEACAEFEFRFYALAFFAHL
jgi:hypothetical protein